MEPETETQCERLAVSCDLRRDEDFGAYAESIDFLRQHPSPEVLDHMLRCLRDVDAGEIQYELVEACEAYDDFVYVPAFIQNGKRLFSHAPQWSELMLCSILNVPKCADLLLATLRSASEDVIDCFRETIQRLSVANAKYRPFLARLPDN